MALQLEKQSKGLFATARMADDAMIDPCDTRDFIGISLSAYHNNVAWEAKEFGTWRTLGRERDCYVVARSLAWRS